MDELRKGNYKNRLWGDMTVSVSVIKGFLLEEALSKLL